MLLNGRMWKILQDEAIGCIQEDKIKHVLGLNSLPASLSEKQDR